MVTLKDIAAEAGVSITTVSNVVHKRANRVSPEMVAKIWAIMEREHYVPSMTARTLANADSSIIGMITLEHPDMPYLRERILTMYANPAKNKLNQA